ncbi:MAG: GNAT family N-acetyltransferase [Clostridia bacterium]|nr:GNAT family N-acetyltransferase [Clostridia bacterium]
MEQAQKAIKFLNRDYILNVSIIEPIRNGAVDILYVDDDCVMVKSKESHVFMIETDDMSKADKLIDTVPDDAAIVAHNPILADLVVSKKGFEVKTPCYQGVYQGEPFVYDQGEMEIRLMREDEAKLACEMYHFKEDSAITHIRRGLAYGAYVGGEAVGMVGMHIQGAMGLLSVKPEYRRHGYAEILEKFIINDVLSKGRVPYCQIVEGNEPSLSLQRKVGMVISKNQLFWLHKD